MARRLHVMEEALLDPTTALFTETAVRRHIRELAPRARRFVFDAEASRYTGRFIGLCADLIFKNRQFATPPYETTYLEFDTQALNEGIGETDPEASNTADKWNAEPDTAVGVLLHDGWIYEFSRGVHNVTGHSCAGLTPLVFRFPAPMTSRPLWFKDWDREGLARVGLAFGSSAKHVDNATLSAVVSSLQIDDLSGGALRVKPNLLNGFNGVIRNVLALTLLLNQPKMTKLLHQPARGVIYKGARRAYAAHSVVAITLGEIKLVRKAFETHLRDAPRAHEVRGHFRHYHLLRECEHEWPSGPNADGHFTCARCGGWRTWVRDHVRGDSAKGFVRKTYEVSP